MSKKLLTEAQVRKFMGLAKLDANLSSNFIQEKYHAKHDDEKEMEEGMGMYGKHDDEVEEGLNLGDKYKKTAGGPSRTADYKPDREMDEGMHDAKADDEMDEGMHDAKADDEMHEGAHEDEEADAEGGDDDGDADDVDVMLDKDEVQGAKEAADKLVSLLDKLMGGSVDMDPEPEMGMDDGPEEMMEETSPVSELTEDEIVQEVAKRVAKRINEAARAKKSNK